MTQEPSRSPRNRPRSSSQRSAVAAHPVTAAAIAVLVAVGVLLVLIVPIYSRLTPKWGDFPFFYWYLLIVMPVVSLLLWLAALLQKRLTAETPAAETAGDAR